MTCRILIGDCRDHMAQMEPNSIDACVTDPPYGLEFMGKEWDKLQNRRDNQSEKHNQQPDKTGRGSWAFGGTPSSEARVVYRAGKTAQAWHETWAREVYRVLKPGGYLLAFGGTRTFHRLTVAIEDAGFEIRDCLMWLYGSGFPKSLDVGKAMDKRGGRPHLAAEIGKRLKSAREMRGMSSSECDRMFCGGTTNWSWFEGRPSGQRAPTPATFTRIAEAWPEVSHLADMVAEAEREVTGQTTKARSTNGASALPTLGAEVEYKTWDETAPATDLARQWDGWGTALKPAWEPIIVARKPLAGTVAANVAQYGTGGINVDGCRIETDENLQRPFGTPSDHIGQLRHLPHGELNPASPLGRWPANLILDEASARLVDAMSGELKSGVAIRKNGISERGMFGVGNRGPEPDIGYGDSGGASRFYKVVRSDMEDSQSESRVFYTAKAGRAERTQGGASGKHPTQKPIDLMQWLCRLVCPPGGTVLDPFAGSGTTGVAADREGFDSILIEQDADYAEDARRKIIGDAPMFAKVEMT